MCLGVPARGGGRQGGVMRIGIIGAGHVGGTLARQFAAAEHGGAVSNSRGPHTLRALVTDLGDHGHAATVEEAAEFGEVLVVSVPFGHYAEVPTSGTAGKPVIDTTNYV